jgi:hypothetical protein
MTTATEVPSFPKESCIAYTNYLEKLKQHTLHINLAAQTMAIHLIKPLLGLCKSAGIQASYMLTCSA